jgi:hypothetical protein
MDLTPEKERRSQILDGAISSGRIITRKVSARPETGEISPMPTRNSRTTAVDTGIKVPDGNSLLVLLMSTYMLADVRKCQQSTGF